MRIFLNVFQFSWQEFCRAVVKVFYRQCEVDGLEYLPRQGAVLLCANHANALADAVLIQAVIPRLVHPLARSGLFKNWLLKPFMLVMQAVPVYRSQDNDGSTGNNMDSFQRVYDNFKLGELILIFPEGQSHSDPKLRPIKTGAARITLGALQQSIPVSVVPLGLNFSNKGKFRSNVLLKFGPPIELPTCTEPASDDLIQGLTQDIQNAIADVTLNVEKADELDFLKSIERFFALRHGKYRKRNQALRFRALKKISHGYQQLSLYAPEEVRDIQIRLRQFERLCNTWKVHAYQVTIQYTPLLVLRFLLRSLAMLLIILPVGLWGILNSVVPFMLTRWLARFISRGTDQYDTAKMTIGLFLFVVFWGIQIWQLSFYLSNNWLWLYILSLPISAAAALLLRRERHRIWVNLRVFFLFTRKRKLKRYLEHRREELERDLARLVRTAKQITPTKPDDNKT